MTGALALVALSLMPTAANRPRQVEVVIETPRAYVPALAPARYKGLHGGRGAGRSHFLADLMVDYALDPGFRGVCLREHQVSLDQSVKLLLEDKIKARGLSTLFRVLDTHIETPGDGIIIFKGLKSYTADSIKSLEGYKVAWVEEAQTLSERSLKLLRPTIRREDGEMWFSWNPRLPGDPIEELLRPAAPAQPPPGAVVLGTNWRHNPWFPEALRLEMEYDRGRDFEKYLQVWEGGYETKSEARVFRNWRVEDLGLDAEPAAWFLGGDWGFSKDPTVLVRMRQVGERALYVRSELYRIGVEIDHIPAFFDGLVPGEPGWARSVRAIADSSRPETISYLQRHGYPLLEAANKGPDSVKEGVIFLQGYDIVVHPSCRHTIDELTHYSYKTDPLTGLVLVPNVLEDKKNHVIDSIRYAAEPIRQPEEWFLW